MSAKRERRFWPETLSGEFPWKNMLFEAVGPKTIVLVGGQYENATQRASWSSSFEYRQTFLVLPVV